MKTIITNEQIQKLLEARKAVLGTPDYYIYDCETDYQRKNKTWGFVGWSYPTSAGTIKVIKGKTWLYVSESTGLHRYALGPAARKVLGLEK